MLKQILVILGSILLASCGGGSSDTTTPRDTIADSDNQAEEEVTQVELFFDFESGLQGDWGLNAGGVLTINNDGAMDTSRSLTLTSRSNEWDGPALTLTNKLRLDAPYDFSLYVKQSQVGQSSIKLTLRYVEQGQQQYQPLSQIQLADDAWYPLRGHYFIESGWSNVVLYVEGLAAGNDLSIDLVHIVQDPTFELAEFSSVNVAALKTLANIPLGVAVPAGNASNSILASGNRQQIVEQHFSQITAENIMKASYLWAGENTYDFSGADALAQYAEQNHLSLHCHVAVWHMQTPNWLNAYQGEAAQWQALLDTYVRDVTQHFGDHCDSWDVVNEAFFDDGTLRDVDQGDQQGSIWMQNIGQTYIENAFIAARGSSPNSLLYYNDYNLVSNATKFAAVKAMASDFLARGIPIDGIGLQMHISDSQPSVAQITETFQQVVELGLKVKITELDIRLNSSGRYTGLTPYLAERQKARVYAIVKAYFDTVPEAQRGGISVWGILDSDSWILQLWPQPDWPLLFDQLNAPKPALQGFADAIADTQNAE